MHIKQDSYELFLEKFEHKRTTDDCYTPPAVYDAVLGWLREQYDLEGKEIIRPFWPGADYKAIAYPEGSVVVDNPPFSITGKIVDWYNERGVKFFLFCNAMSGASTIARANRCCMVVSDSSIVYENGAEVATSFITNLFPEEALVLSRELKERIDTAQGRGKKPKRPKIAYPRNVKTLANMHKYVDGLEGDLRISRAESQPTIRLEAQLLARKSIFGMGYFVSDRVAQELDDALERRNQQGQLVQEWQLVPTEQMIIDRLNNH